MQYFAVLLFTAASVLGRPGPGGLREEVVCPPSTDGFPVFLPDPTDCTKYYECQGDWAISMDCAPPLFFDPALSICNWPNMVECQQQTTEEEPATTQVPATTEEQTEEPTGNEWTKVDERGLPRQ